MKATTILTAAMAAPIAVRASIFGFNTFGETSQNLAIPSLAVTAHRKKIPVSMNLTDIALSMALGCNGFQENIHITQAGNNINKFPGPRKSFVVLETDHTCSPELCTGTTIGTGACITFGTDLAVGTCFGYADGSAANSFNVFCRSGFSNVEEEKLNVELV